MDWIQPLQLKTWFISVFSGGPDVFLAVSLLALFGLAAYFRMTALTMFFFVGLYVLMFSEHLTSPIFVIFSMIGGLIIGYLMVRFFK
jgi:hypothetical protein